MLLDRRRSSPSSASIMRMLFLLSVGLAAITCTRAAQLRPSHMSLNDDLAFDSPGWYEQDVKVICTEDEMLITITPKETGVSFLDKQSYSKDVGRFSGSVYPQGLGRATGCLVSYRTSESPLMYRLPLRACNTMPYTLDDGRTEYRNIIMVQPHPRLVTGRGRSHHVSCVPAARQSSNQPRTARLQDVRGEVITSNVASAEAEFIPAGSMKIYKGNPAKKEVATNVKIGDPLTLVVTLNQRPDQEKPQHLKVTDCTVRDGLGWAQQNLLNDDGCPLDNEIMGRWQYSADGSTATVTFQAHKFPYTASVYYQCQVKLCHEGEPCKPQCDGANRVKRQAEEEESTAKIQVFSGLYVNEATDLPPDTDFVTSEKYPEDAICISQRNFAIAICIAGLVLMLAVVTALLVILARRRGPKSISNTGSSIYSGPYTDTGYSHTG